MTPKRAEKEKAIALRRQGMSVNDIAVEVNVAKSSVFGWVKDVPLSEGQRNVLQSGRRKDNQKKAVAALKEKTEKKNQANLKKGAEMAGIDPAFAIIAAMYWGEGNKANPHEWSIANADPKFLRVVVNWFDARGIAWKMDCQYHPNNGLSEEEIKEYWVSEIPTLAKRRFALIQSKLTDVRGNLKGRQPYGCCKLSALGGTNLKWQTKGGIEYLINLYGEAKKESEESPNDVPDEAGHESADDAPETDAPDEAGHEDLSHVSHEDLSHEEPRM